MLNYRFINLIVSLVICNLCYCDLIDHFKPVGPKRKPSQMRNIDFIYVINLDRRPERWQDVLKELVPYDILPHRFSAVDGWALPSTVLNDIGVTITPETKRCPKPDKYGSYFLPDLTRINVDLDEKCYGKKFISNHTSRGAVGCTLSHFSILEDAYNSGYETIWVMEDDIRVAENPHIISDLVDRLDGLVGREGWDLLYTEEGYYPAFGDYRDKNLSVYSYWIWRPDMFEGDTSSLVSHKNIGSDFIKIGLKWGTRSMIIRRSGMKKILDFAKNQGIFLPIDCELAFIPQMKLFITNRNIVVTRDLRSDTHDYHP